MSIFVSRGDKAFRFERKERKMKGDGRSKRERE